MGLQIYLFIVQCLIFCNQYVFVHGQNRNAREGEFPFVVSISNMNYPTRPDKNHVCAGVLISNKDVLTLERCSHFVEEGATEIVVGTINLRVGIKHYPCWWLTYDKWASDKNIQAVFPHNELTFIRLTAPVSDAINPAVCATTQNPQLYGSNVITAGWGDLVIGMTPRIMRTAILQALTNAECQQKVNRLFGQRAFHLYDNYLCTSGDNHPDEWHMMDFGGPLLYNGELIAINQESHPFPTNPPHPEKLNLHIRLDYYSDFIQDVKNNY